MRQSIKKTSYRNPYTVIELRATFKKGLQYCVHAADTEKYGRLNEITILKGECYKIFGLQIFNVSSSPGHLMIPLAL
jgi:hypothetical protein